MNRRVSFVVGALTFSALMVLSVFFYKERVVFLDISYHLFEILRTGAFAIQNNRICAFSTQLFPLFGSKLGLSLSAVALGYSLSFLLLYFGTFMVILMGLKNVRIAIAYLLFVMLITTHTFYWIQSELPQGVAFLFLLLALFDNWLNHHSKPFYFYFVLPILSLFVALAHPLLLFAFVFALLFFAVSHPQKIKQISAVSIPYFAVYFAKNLLFKSEYDSGAMSGLKNFLTLFPNYFFIPSNQEFLYYITHEYVFLFLLFVVVCGYYVVRKSYWKLALVVAFSLGYTLLINVSYANGSPSFYLENQYLLLTIFVGLPFATEVLPAIFTRNVQIIIIVAIVFSGIFRIYNGHHLYTERLNWYRSVLAETEGLPNKKIIYSSEVATPKSALMTWATPYEFWLLSTLESTESRSIVWEERPNEFDWTIGENRAFIGRWGVFDYDSLNKNYFHFNDTSYYVKLQK